MKVRALHQIDMTNDKSNWELIEILSGNLGQSNKSMRGQTSTQLKTGMKGNNEEPGKEKDAEETRNEDTTALPKASRGRSRKIKHP